MFFVSCSDVIKTDLEVHLIYESFPSSSQIDWQRLDEEIYELMTTKLIDHF